MEGYDYALAGGYFVTICTENRAHSLGRIAADTVSLTSAGQVTFDTWSSLPERFPFVSVDAFVVMPNHVHGVLILADPHGLELGPKPLGAVIRAFKAASTRTIRTSCVPDFEWQRDYYDHIIRNEQELQRIREYIEANPARWGEDPENVAGLQSRRGGRPESWEV